MPAVEDRALRLEAPLANRLEHGTEMVVLGGILGVVVNAVVARDVAVAIRPQQRHEADPLDDRMVFARPVASDQFDGLGVGLVEDGVIRDEDAVGQGYLRSHLLSKRLGIRFESVQQSGEGVMGWRSRLIGLHSDGFGGTARFGGGDQEVDVVFGLHTRGIHAPKITDPASIAHAENPSTA